ncbi:MAG: DUF1826 domain-containing protein [Pseudomonadota bacterium]
MSLAATIEDARAVVAAGAPEELSSIHRPECAAVLWRRETAPSLQRWVDGLDPETLPRAREILRPEAVRGAVARICDAQGTPDVAERARLIDDIAAAAQVFAGVMSAAYVRLRLGVVTNNACRKFHVDAVTARLICTYRGTGTQYGWSTSGAEPERIFTVPTGAPFVLRGTLWPETPRSGLVHRSPPIAGSGETRLVLVLDPLDEMSDEADHAVR